jgi:transposase
VARHPGAACLSLPLLRELGVVEAIDQECASQHTVSHGVITQLLTLNRLQAPRPIYKVGEWLARTGLAQTLGVEPEQAHDTRLGETLDALSAHHQAIWQTVIQRAVQRYGLPLDWLHYDITSTYFEGVYAESEWVAFGYSRDQRPDSKQLNVGLTVTGHGCPLAFRVLAGNTADKSTGRENMEAVRRLLETGARREATIIHDRALATVDTLAWYGQHHQNFISPITTDSALQSVMDDVSAEELFAQPLSYRPARAADGPPQYCGVWREHTLEHGPTRLRLRVLIVYSHAKAKLDAEKRQAALDRLLQRLGEIQAHLNQRKYKQRTYTLTQLHLAQRGNPMQHLVEVELGGEDGALTLHYQVNAERLAQALQREGRYPLVTNRWDLSADEVLERVKAQDRVEKRFAVVKGPLHLHPLWLHKDERLISLVLVVMLALLVYCLLEHLARQAQRHVTGRSLLAAFADYTLVQVSFRDGSSRWLYPDLSPPQASLLKDLALPLPAVTLQL